jgi:hypothetical protein
MADEVPTSRRSALKALVMGALLTGAAGTLAIVRSRGYVAPAGRVLASLSVWELAVVTHAARRIAAPDRPGDASIPSADDVDVAGFVDAYAARMSTPLRRDLSRALLYLEQVAPVAIGLPRRFTELTSDEQDRVLSSLETSSVLLLRGVFNSLKSLVFMGYYRDARTWSLIRYDGPWLGRGDSGRRTGTRPTP